MSFGTNTDTNQLSSEKIQMFVNVFSKLPYDVLWKWDGDELSGLPDNVKMSKWYPQPDLLSKFFFIILQPLKFLLDRNINTTIDN